MFEFVLLLFSILNAVHCEIEYNTINEDGSFSFRHTNDDIGGYYHAASGSPDNIVRGRYGSRNPATGQVEEVVYTAGPRGYRVNGPKIHRKMDLAQFPTLPRGSPDDPLADPYDDPSYSFTFRTPDQSRSEDNDATSRVRGLYSYIDDVGERHSVRYAAGAGTGFEVSNAVPDNPAVVGYTAPLYKAPPKTRGKMSVQRGPNGSYKLIAAGPDQRRAESRGSDGLVRGTYSYLDDKGVQRTVEYIAGAGIGYRVVQNRIGPGTHINPSVADFRLSDTDFKLANDFDRGAGGPLGGGVGVGGSSGATNDYLATAGADSNRRKDVTGGVRNINDDVVSGNGGATAVNTGNARNGIKSDRMGTAAGRRGGTRYRGDSGGTGVGTQGTEGEDTNISMNSRAGGRNKPGERTTNNRNAIGGERGGGGGANTNRGYNYDAPASHMSSSTTSLSSSLASSSSVSSNSVHDNYNLSDDDVGGSLPPLITANRKILEIDRERDWVQRHRDSTVIKNVGKWYIGLPPGQSVRAHVQNIDLVPLGGRRVPSPSEALRQDELADMVATHSSMHSVAAAYRGS